MPSVHIYTDGASIRSSVQKLASWAFVIPYSGYKKYFKLTGILADMPVMAGEIKAATEGIRYVKNQLGDVPVVVVTDHPAVCLAINGQIHEWANAGWKNKNISARRKYAASRNGVAFKEYWMELREELLAMKDVRAVRVLGHSGVKFNEAADFYAKKTLGYYLHNKHLIASESTALPMT